MHKSPEELLEYYSKEVLPEDFGGEEESLEKLQGITKVVQKYI